MSSTDRPDAGLNRRELLRRGALGAGTLAAGGYLAACGSGGSTPQGTASTGGAPGTSTGPAAGGTPTNGGTLRVAMLSQGTAETLAPPKAIVQPDYLRIFNLYDPLFFNVPNGTAPALATSAEPNRDGTVWTLKLRDGVTWHDGKPFTADDVVYTIKSSWAGKGSAYETQTKALVAVDRVKKIDALTVEVPLVRPFGAFPAFTSWVNAAVIQDGTTDFSHPIGTGPFKYVSFAAGKQSTFERNADYWNGAPRVDRLLVDSSFTDDAARLNAVQSGQMDIAPGVPFALAKALGGTGRVVLGNVPGPAFITVVMRVNVPPFNDPRVTQAFKLAVDRQKIVDNAYSGFATVGNDLVGYTWDYFAKDLKAEYDPEKAKALLKAAGQEDLALPMYTAQTLPGQNEVGTLVSADLKKIGVNAPLKQLPVDTYFTTASPAYLSDQRKLYTTYWYNFAPALGAFYDQALTPTGQYDETGWGHKAGQNTLISDAKGEVDPAKAADKWRAVQEQQVKEGGYLLPAWFNWLDAYAPKVRGVVTNSAGACANYDFHKAWLAPQ
jgi:peptide/nickel transport system substrate-binding protein